MTEPLNPAELAEFTKLCAEGHSLPKSKQARKAELQKRHMGAYLEARAAETERLAGMRSKAIADRKARNEALAARKAVN